MRGTQTLEDAIGIRRRILIAFERAERAADPTRRHELLTFVIVGGGPTGVELAGTLAEIARQTLRDEFRAIDPARARIVLVEAGATILPTFPERLRRAARTSLERLGVTVREGTAVTAVDAHGVMIGAERLDAGTVVWAAGVTASSLTRTLGAPLDHAGRVLVEPDLSIPGHPHVFVVGDAAAFLYRGNRPLPGRPRRRQCRGDDTQRARFCGGHGVNPRSRSSTESVAAWPSSGAARPSATWDGSGSRACRPGWPGCSCTSSC